MSEYEPIKPGDSVSSDHLQDALFTPDHRQKMSITVMAISSVMIVAPLLCHYVKSKAFELSAQLVAMYMGVITAVIFYWFPLDKFSGVMVSPYNMLTIYYTFMMVRFVYPMDTYVFRKSLSHILLIGVLGWLVFVICFGFLLLTFAGELTTLTFTKLCLIGVLFAPLELPSVLLNMEQMKHIRVVMMSESIITSILSILSLNLLFGDLKGLFIYWYQPVLVFMRLFLGAIVLGIGLGFLSALIFSKYCINFAWTLLSVMTTNFMLYHITQFGVSCSGGLSCFIGMLLISQKRIMIPQHIDKEVVVLIDVIYYIMSIVTTFLVVCNTLPQFLDSFTVMTTAVSLALYICANACRLVFFISISPLLSRWGYGMNFKSLVTMVWCVKKGPLPFILLSVVVFEGFHEVVPKKTLVLGLNYMFLINALNELSSWSILKKLGLAGNEFLLARANVKNAFKIIEKIRDEQLAITRMNRYYNDANWKIIIGSSLISSKIANDDDTLTYEDGLTFEKMQPFCNNCQIAVEHEPSKREYQDKLDEVNLRVLHAVRVSFVRQFDCGFIDIVVLRALLRILDEALDSKDHTMKFEPVLAQLQEKHHNKYYEGLRKRLFIHNKKQFKGRYVPRYPRCYRIMTNVYFMAFFDFLTLLQFCLSASGALNHRHFFMAFLTIALIFYFVEFAVKIFACQSINTKDGFHRYIKPFWNKFDFILLLYSIVDFLLCILIDYFYIYLRERSVFYRVRLFIHGSLRMARIFRIFRWTTRIRQYILRSYDERTDAKLRYVYAIGRGLVTSYEDVDDILNTLTDEPKISKNVRLRLQTDRNKIAKELGLIEMTRPLLIMALKTRQGLMCTMTTIHNAAKQLSVDGLLDADEYLELNDVIADKWEAVNKIKTIPNPSPKSILAEIVWLDGEEHVFKFLYEKVKLIVWDTGDVIYSKGDVAEGVYVIVTGMIKVVYNPTKEMLDNLHMDGLLPVKDMIRQPLFDFPTEEYISIGSSIGELSVMTGRPYCCDVYAEIPTQAFILTKNVIAEAMALSIDPINGLFSRIWTHIVYKFVKLMLREVPLYSDIKWDQMNALMARSFIAKMDAYTIFRANDNIEEIVLVEGTLADYVTQEVFVAPCIIPRGSPALIVIDTRAPNSLGSKAKVFIVPKVDMDPYEVMIFSEIISDLDTSASSDCFLFKHENFRKWQKNRRSMPAGLWRSSGSMARQKLSVNQILLQSMEKMKSHSDVFLKDESKDDEEDDRPSESDLISQGRVNMNMIKRIRKRTRR